VVAWAVPLVVIVVLAIVGALGYLLDRSA